ncbi:Kiwa anti-phage protein KwaB-like domain-containing protein [Bradyrhizobium sp. DASA03120]|uniref:Kiwa anti-phage protein KwaB-like domain-containing protein n=1 Tax=Bradyrhizobium sp. SMVTL-02 TaxID=3395917 RepID=UPI003F72017F
MNLFALMSDRRIVRIPLTAEVQLEMDATFEVQEKRFRTSCEEQIPFDGKYKPDDGECLFIDDYDDIDGLHRAIANPLSIPQITPTSDELEGIKALFTGKNVDGQRIALIQNFDKRKIISNRGFSIFHSADVFKKVEGVGLTIGMSLSAILEEKRLYFFSFYSARQIFDLSQYFREATDEDLSEFAASDMLKISDPAAFVAASDNWVRRKVALIMQSGILERIDFEATKASALIFGINIETEANGDKAALVLPTMKPELKKLLRFLDEDYFQSVLSSTPHLSNSKRPV